jgi:hypothetical protein
MCGADELELLRKAYQEALIDYEGVSASLNRHALAGTKPGPEELQHERDARLTLERARRRYLDAWQRS